MLHVYHTHFEIIKNRAIHLITHVQKDAALILDVASKNILFT